MKTQLKDFKFYLGFFVVYFTYHTLYAQWVQELNPSTTYFGDDFIEVATEITNISASAKVFVWERTSIKLPDRWLTAICDPVLCLGNEVDRSQFELPANSKALLICYFYLPLNPVEARAEVGLKIWEQNQPAVFQEIKYTGKYEQPSSTLKAKQAIEIQNFDNHILQVKLSPNTHFEWIQITDNMGRLIDCKGTLDDKQECYSIDVSNLSIGNFIILYAYNYAGKIHQRYLKLMR